MRLRRPAFLSFTALALVVLSGTPGSAHPLGNFTVNTSARFLVSPDVVDLRYVVDFAEIPTTQAIGEIDSNADGVPQPEELARWAEAKCPLFARNMTITLDGTTVKPSVASSDATGAPGQAPGTRVIRLMCGYRLHVGDRGAVTFLDGNFQGGAGWAEITAAPRSGAAVTRSTVPQLSPTDELRSYPPGAKDDPLDVVSAEFSFEADDGSGAGASPSGSAGSGSGAVAEVTTGAPQGGFAGVLNSSSAAIALLLAIGFGALHALAPGHGKTFTAAYLVGAEARPAQAAFAGVLVAFLHALSVLVLAGAIVWIQGFLRPDQAYPVLGLVSGLVVLALGIALLRRRLRGDEHTHDPVSRKGLAAIALGGGLVPSPTAVVVLLGAVALGRTALGIALVIAFSVGLGAALVAIAVLSMRVRDALAERSQRYGRLIGLGGAWVTVAVGLFLIVRAGVQLYSG